MQEKQKIPKCKCKLKNVHKSTNPLKKMLKSTKKTKKLQSIKNIIWNI